MRSLRLYIDAPFVVTDDRIPLEPHHIHYLLNVMRVSQGDTFRVFNGQDGEWKAEINYLSKKKAEVILKECLRAQNQGHDQNQEKEQNQAQDHAQDKFLACHLYFSPLKHSQTSYLIEKATELGVTDFPPVLFERTNTRTFKSDQQRLTAIEAAEQSERLTIPVFHPLSKLHDTFKGLPDAGHIFVCDERRDARPLKQYNIALKSKTTVHLFIGPEGGFSEKEFALFAKDARFAFVTLSPQILRAETAALCALSQI